MTLDLHPSSTRAQMSEVSKALNVWRYNLSDNAKAVMKRRYQAKDVNGLVTEPA